MEPNQQTPQPNNQPPAPYQGGSQLPNTQTSPPNYPSGNGLPRDHHKGLLIGLIVAVVLLIGAIVFGVWSFMERQTYKNETDRIVAEEVEAAVAANTETLEAEFEQREKEPLTTYSGPSALGSIRISYPKTWSAHAIENDRGNTPLEGYFHPNYVPDVSGDENIALSIEVVNRDYESSISQFDRAVNRNEVSVSPIDAVNVSGVLGTRIDGEIDRDTQGSVVLFELRDKTLVLRTESNEFIDDFNSIILENLEFNP